MLEDLEEDTHLCIKCSSTIVGLENYVQHRKSHCNKATATTPQYNFNYEIDTVHHDSNTSHILPSPMHQSEKVSDYKTDPNKSLSESYDYNYGLGADIFFSSLNLQSSSKLKTQNVTSNVNTENASVIKTNDDKIIMQRKANDSGNLSNDAEHMDDWINTEPSTSGTEKLMKAVNAISGTKKLSFDSPQYNYEYVHDHGSPEVHTTFDDEDDDEIEEDEIDEAPPHTHTGGKWKPSERNNRSMHSTSRW